MPRQIQLANNFRTKQRNHVGTLGEKKPRNNFLGDGCSPKNAPALQHNNFLPRLSKVSRVHKSVVAAADNDDVVVLRHAEKLRSKCALKEVAMRLEVGTFYWHAPCRTRPGMLRSYSRLS